MNTPGKYSVLRFGLQQDAEGRYTQEIQRCGVFQSVEHAFATARMEALREWQEACAEPETVAPKAIKVSIRDTEWGYELHREHLVFTRYWVHDTQPATLPGVTA